MNAKIVVTTDFSEASANALDYACAFAKAYHFGIAVIRIFTIPSNYAGEGLSLAAVDDAMAADKQRLEDELDRAKKQYGLQDVDGQMVVGDYQPSIEQIISTLNPAMIVVGAGEEYSQLWQWDAGWLNALVSVACPILVVPSHIGFRPVKRIAVACDYKKVCTPGQHFAISGLVRQTAAELYLVHVTPKIGLNEQRHLEAFRETFAAQHPHFYTVENKYVIKGIAEFVKDHQIDMLLVIPREHGLWYSLFNKSYTRQLARLNDLPVIAIHENS